MSRKFSKPNNGDSDQERRAQLFQDLIDNLGAATEMERSKVYAHVGQIGANFEYRLRAAVNATDNSESSLAEKKASSLAEKKAKLKTSVERFRKALEVIDREESYERIFGTATDNPFAGPQLHETGRHRHNERLKRRGNLIALLEEEEADSQERLNAPGWSTKGGRANVHSMAHGNPFSRIFTDCCPLFEEFQAGSISYSPGSKFFNVAACVFELITGHDPNNNDLGLSLENQVRKAVELYKKHAGRS